MTITQDNILDFVRKNGPLLSIKVAKYFKMNTTYAGAYLSELVSKKKIKFSNMKIGTSPLYYVDSQKEKLQDFADKLSDGEKRVFDLLKKNKILREGNLDALTKATLRNMKDFAVSLVVNFKNKKEVFWKFYMLDNNEAQGIIKEILAPKKIASPKPIETKKPEQRVKPEIEKEIKKVEKEEITDMSEVKASEHDQKSSISDKPKEQLLEKKKEIEKKEKELFKEKQKLEKEFHKTIEQDQKELEEQRKVFSQQRKEMKKQRQELMQMMEEIRQERIELERLKTGKESIESVQTKIVPISERIKKEKDKFFQQVREYMFANDMKIKDYEIIKKGEVDLVVSVPGAIGSVDYYCCAKKKKRSNEGDLSTAYIKGQNKKLPVLYLSLGNVTKKAQEMLNKEFKAIVVKKIE